MQPELLDVEAVANELAVSIAAVRRIIALRKLRAARIRGDLWRVARADLSDYVKRGAPDLQAPDFSGDWFSHEDQAHVAHFDGKVTAMLRNHTLDQAAIVKRYEAEKFAPDSLNISASITPDIRAFAMEPAPTNTYGQPSRYANRLEQFLTNKLRNEAAGLFARNLNASPRVLQLYDSPEAFEENVTNARRALLQRRLGFSEVVPVEKRPDASPLTPNPPKVVRVWYLMTFETLASLADLKRVEALAF